MTEAAAAPSDILQPGKPPPATSEQTEPAKIKATYHFGQGVPVPESMKANAVSNVDAQREVIGEAFRAMGVPEEVLAQQRARTPVTQQEYDLAMHRKNSLMQDKEWRKRYFDGGVNERREFATLHIILGSNIKTEGK
jgi:hypothetical protein